MRHGRNAASHTGTTPGSLATIGGTTTGSGAGPGLGLLVLPIASAPEGLPTATRGERG